jgi:hypothetical protein
MRFWRQQRKEEVETPGGAGGLCGEQFDPDSRAEANQQTRLAPAPNRHTLMSAPLGVLNHFNTYRSRTGDLLLYKQILAIGPERLAHEL